MQRLLVLIFFFLAFSCLRAQDIGGIWKGTLTQGPGGCFPVYNIELDIKIEGTRISGVSYHYSDLTNYVKENFEGTFNTETKMMMISEMKVLTFHVPSDCVPCIKRYSLFHRKELKNETLVGEWGGMIFNQSVACPPGRITLSRAVESDFNHIKEIKVDTGTIRLDFYDNGVIDGDSITVLLNNKVLVANQMLSAKPITIEIKVDMDHREQEVVMVADNMGSIPPNTALLIITAGIKRYQLFMASTEQKSATVRFIYEEKH